MSCRKALAWYELIPVLSYLFLKGKCRGCFSYIPSRYFFVEVLTGFLYILVYYCFASNHFLLFLNMLLVSILVLIIVYDIRHTIIPDELTVLVLGISVIQIVYLYIQQQNLTNLYEYILGGGLSFLFFFSLWFLSKGTWIGLGDAKLALPLGIIVGGIASFSMVVLAFWIGAGISLVLLALERITKRGKMRLHFLASPLTIKSEVPFAPFLITGFVLVHFFHANIFTITSRIFFLE